MADVSKKQIKQLLNAYGNSNDSSEKAQIKNQIITYLNNDADLKNSVINNYNSKMKMVSSKYRQNSGALEDIVGKYETKNTDKKSKISKYGRAIAAGVLGFGLGLGLGPLGVLGPLGPLGAAAGVSVGMYGGKNFKKDKENYVERKDGGRKYKMMAGIGAGLATMMCIPGGLASVMLGGLLSGTSAYQIGKRMQYKKKKEISNV